MNPSHTDEPNETPPERSFFGIIVHSFFIIPFLIAVFCVLLFTAVHLLTREQQSAYDYLEDVKTGGLTKRWQAAFELSKILASPDSTPKDERFTNELSGVFRHSIHDDSRVRQYLALAMGRTGNPEFFDVLVENIDKENEENLYAIIYSLGMLKDRRAVPVLKKFLDHPQARIRSVTVVALGTIGEISSKDFLKKALSDSEPNVQWGASISLAQMGDSAGKGILLKLLDRGELSKYPEVDPHEQNHLILAAIEASKNLQDPELNTAIRALADTDPNMKVRAAAMDYSRKLTNVE